MCVGVIMMYYLHLLLRWAGARKPLVKLGTCTGAGAGAGAAWVAMIHTRVPAARSMAECGPGHSPDTYSGAGAGGSGLTCHAD